ncbi:hypothetical protein V8F06_009320 [Rhypophila decipiens]
MKLISTLIGLALVSLASARQECQCRGNKPMVPKEGEFCCLWAPGSYLGSGDCLLEDNKVHRFDICCQEIGYNNGLYCI